MFASFCADGYERFGVMPKLDVFDSPLHRMDKRAIVEAARLENSARRRVTAAS